MQKCLQCTSDTSNPKFCNHSCAARYNNVHYPKRVLQGACTKCENPAHAGRRYCQRCRPPGQIHCKYTTLGDIATVHNRSDRASIVRNYARRVLLAAGHTACAICGYHKHIDCAHRIPVASFPLDARISDVNSVENLVPLCPTHHWEYDHGQLEPTDAVKLNRQ